MSVITIQRSAVRTLQLEVETHPYKDWRPGRPPGAEPKSPAGWKGGKWPPGGAGVPGGPGGPRCERYGWKPPGAMLTWSEVIPVPGEEGVDRVSVGLPKPCRENNDDFLVSAGTWLAGSDLANIQE